MMTRRSVAAGALAAALVLGGCGGRSRREAPAEAAAVAPDAAASPEPSPGPSETPLAQITATVCFASAEREGFVGVPREILDTKNPGDRAKQILAELIAGPAEGDGALAALPEGTTLRQVYVLTDGVAWVDLSREFAEALGRGVEIETLAVYAVVDSLVLNVPEIKRVGLLVDGHNLDAVNSHLDLRRPLAPEPSFVSSAPPAASGSAQPSPNAR